MLKSVLDLLVCPSCQADSLNGHVFRGTDEEIIDGAVTCPACRAIYPVQNRLLDLVPAPLLNIEALEALERQYHDELQALGYLRPSDAGTAAVSLDFADQIKQRVHFDNYADGVKQRYDDYANMPFWRAADLWTFKRWQKVIPADEFVLDVGCADGRSSFPYLPRNKIIGFDISRKMVRRAIDHAVSSGYAGRFSFFVADGSSVPFRSASLPYVQTYGVLHHLPKPGLVVRDIQRVLKVGGIHFASENNASSMRLLFDLMMRYLPIWHEEAGEEALISRKMVDSWARGLPVKIESETIVFLPPHVFNLFSQKRASQILNATNMLCGKMPWLRQNGGLIVFKLQKLDAQACPPQA